MYGARIYWVVEGEPIVAGTNETCDIVLPNALTEPRHARISVAAGELWIDDLGAGSTAVNGELVTRARLRAGDRLLLGLVALAVRDAAG